jgi:hypothetical protein
MTVEEHHSGGERTQRPRPTRAQRIVAAAFLGAFGLTMLTVLLTGLAVRAPRSRTGAYAPPPAAAVERSASGEAAAPGAAQAPETRSSGPEDEANDPHEPASVGDGSERIRADDR